MKPRLRILHLEDNFYDRELAQIALAQDDLDHQFTPVLDEAGFRAALQSGRFDVILSDSSLPGFDGRMALQIAREMCPEIPFLFLTGHCPPERAAELIAAGATAAISKSNLASLSTRIEQALTRQTSYR